MPAAQEIPIVIVGAGLAGLTCARYLHDAGLPVRVLEKENRVGGRIATDVVDGFRFDRGFQVFLTAYPEAQALLDYDALDLCPFYDGALVRFDGAFHRVADPIRHPASAPSTLVSPVGSLRDKLRVARARNRLRADSLDALFARPELTTRDALANRWKFSPTIIERFFRPFVGGITLDPALAASSRTFEFVFRMFSEGSAALPGKGMHCIPEQLAASLPEDAISLNTEVKSVRPRSVTLADGQEIQARAVVIATDAPAAQMLHRGAATTTASVGEMCLYYAMPTPPTDEPILILSAESGPINNLSVLSNVAPRYAPPGQSLVSVVVLTHTGDPGALELAVRNQLRKWYGDAVAQWRHLRTYPITYGLPDQSPPYLVERDPAVKLDDGLFRCGDHLSTASINGAMRTGRRAAEAIRTTLA